LEKLNRPGHKKKRDHKKQPKRGKKKSENLSPKPRPRGGLGFNQLLTEKKEYGSNVRQMVKFIRVNKKVVALWKCQVKKIKAD